MWWHHGSGSCNVPAELAATALLVAGFALLLWHLHRNDPAHQFLRGMTKAAKASQKRRG